MNFDFLLAKPGASLAAWGEAWSFRYGGLLGGVHDKAPCPKARPETACWSRGSPQPKPVHLNRRGARFWAPKVSADRGPPKSRPSGWLPLCSVAGPVTSCFPKQHRVGLEPSAPPLLAKTP